MNQPDIAMGRATASALDSPSDRRGRQDRDRGGTDAHHPSIRPGEIEICASEIHGSHRDEIDGLRALAILPVFLFHAGVKTFSGGFVGVDVFFVVSGFLITSIVLRDMSLERFSFAEFCERRARRILPALFLVTVCCLPLAWLVMFPAELKAFAQSLMSVGLLASNVLFWMQSGYFAVDAEQSRCCTPRASRSRSNSTWPSRSFCFWSGATVETGYCP